MLQILLSYSITVFFQTFQTWEFTSSNVKELKLLGRPQIK